MYAAICAVDRYVISYVEGFMAEREIQILRDQEQTRRALSAALERQRRELYVKDHAINTSINGIIITDLEGRVTYVNPAFLVMWGYNDSDKVIGKNYIEFVKSEESQKQITSSAIRKKGGWRGEMILQRVDGSSVEIEVSVSSILDAAGNPLGNMVSFTDISDRKRLEAEFRQAQKMEALNTLAGGIAHDFNNLLTTVLGNTSLMLMDIKPTHPHYQRLKIIESQVESGSKLTKQLLGYARKGKYEVKPINLNRLVLETSETFGRTRKEVTIYRELDEDLVAIEADRGQIEQVLLNLYINAADAMPGSGELVLRTRSVILKESKFKHSVIPPGKYVTLSVADTGMGMDTNTIERIFDPFFTTKEMGRGVGLGLASAYGIIKNHGGYIDVKSSKGTGTTFVIYLPASDKEEVESTKSAEQVWKGKEAILMVDDEEPVLDISVKLLKTMGYTVFAARSGREALGIYQTEKDRIALVILDMIMPMMGGGDTYEKLKQINPDVKVLLASGYSIDGQASQILTRGCNGFIQKPFKLGELSKKIRTVLDDN
jgi:PAS domain S-box-containing protein